MPPGTPCSYTPAPSAAAAVEPDAVRGRRRRARSAANGFPGAARRRRSSPPNPDGLPPTPGIPIAGRPGEPPSGRPGHTGAAAAQRTAGSAHRGPARRARPAAVDVRAGPAPATRAAGTGSCRPRSSHPAERAVAAQREVARIERHLRYPQPAATARVIGRWWWSLALVAGFVGWQLYQKLTNNTVVAYFPAANALYPGTRSRSWAFAWARSTRSSRPATR